MRTWPQYDERILFRKALEVEALSREFLRRNSVLGSRAIQAILPLDIMMLNE